MKFLFCLTLLFSPSAFSSSSYISGSSTLVSAARNVFGSNAGFGTTSCTLCHLSGQTGLNTIPSSGFGTDFNSRATALVGQGHSLSQSQLETVLNDSTLQNADSDGDGQSNAVEITAGTNPNDSSNGSGSTSSGGGGGGGCGMIGTTPPPSKGLFLLLLMPFLIILKKKWELS